MARALYIHWPFCLKKCPYCDFNSHVRDGVDAAEWQAAPLADDPAADLFELTRALTDATGLPAYEVSNHARSGEESRHNLAYWRYQDYVGIGPGAHGRRGGMATRRQRKPENFLAAVGRNGHGLSEERALNPREQAAEALLMGLRLREGVDPAALARRFGVGVVIEPHKLALHESLGLVWTASERIGVTPQGMPVLDALLGELVPDALAAA